MRQNGEYYMFITRRTGGTRETPIYSVSRGYHANFCHFSGITLFCGIRASQYYEDSNNNFFVDLPGKMQPWRSFS